MLYTVIAQVNLILDNTSSLPVFAGPLPFKASKDSFVSSVSIFLAQNLPKHPTLKPYRYCFLGAKSCKPNYGETKKSIVSKIYEYFDFYLRLNDWKSIIRGQECPRHIYISATVGEIAKSVGNMNIEASEVARNVSGIHLKLRRNGILFFSHL